MSQLAFDVALAVVDKVNESEILVENKSEQSSEEIIEKNGESQKKRNVMDKILFRKPHKPQVPPKAAKKSKPILENKTEMEDVSKFTLQKFNEKSDENLQTTEVATTEPAANLLVVPEKIPELDCLSIQQIKETKDSTELEHSSSENDIPKQVSREPQVSAIMILENPTEMQVDPSNVTTLPTPVMPYANDTKKHNGPRKDTRIPSYTNLSRRSSASSSTSRSSLGVSAAPSSSSMCHLTELAQPTTVHLESTLARLRQLNANTERVQQHLKDLRNRPTLAIKAKKSFSDARINRSQWRTESKSLPSRRISSLSATADKCDLSADPSIYEKLADRLFETLESKLTVKNATEQLVIPVESNYYRAAYAGLVRIWGQPYTKCSLELHQHLATELGLLAETFVMDSTRGMSLETLHQQKNGVHFTT